MAKGEKAQPVNTERDDKLALITVALFAVRLYRKDSVAENMSEGAHAIWRERAALDSASDAQALLAAAEKISRP